MVRYEDLTNAHRKKIIRSHLFIKEKFDASGIIEKLKSRLVGDGHTQARPDDPHANYFPTARLESILNDLKIIGVDGRYFIILDTGGAYLNSDINEEIFMYIQPEDIPNSDSYIDNYGKC